ncbi:MAG: OmpA family protein [Pseudoflavonifractor sp.]|nr:OmpA family protein [Alloprevotella sp.]MCM1116212.1 OmpA family protein [Pseudoflavonifractor sp.]
MSELNDSKRIGAAPETPRIGAHHAPEALPGHIEEPADDVMADETVATGRTGFMGAGPAVILLLAAIVVAALLLFVTHGGRNEYRRDVSTSAFYMGPTKISSPGTAMPGQENVAAVFATSPQAAAAAMGTSSASQASMAAGEIPVVVYLFNYDSNNVPENEALSQLAADLTASGREVAIVAYTDPRGSVSYNQRLSERRAKAVGDYLVAHGVDRSNIKTKGAGPTDAYPSAQLDRRAVITPM